MTAAPVQTSRVAAPASPATPAARLLTVVRLLAILIALGALPVGVRLNGPPVDFAQLYMGGSMARTGQWNALYPVPLPNAEGNAGYPDGSKSHPAYERVAMELGIGDSFRFIHAPPVALLMAPLTLLPLSTAQHLWTILMALCVGGSAVYAGLLFRELRGPAPLQEAAVVLATALLPRALFSSAIGNVSPLVGLCLGTGILTLLRNNQRQAAAATIIGAFAKYAPALLLFVMVLRRSWRALAYTAAAAVTVSLVTLAFSGPQPFVVFFRDIWPTLQRPTLSWTSQTVWGTSTELWGGTTAYPLIHTLLQILKGVSFLGIAVLLIWRARRAPLSRENTIAGTLVLLCWLLLFGPITWGHYAAYFAPFTGWLYHVCRANKGKIVWGALIVLLVFIPWKSVPLPAAPAYVLVHFSLFLGILLFGALASYLLARNETESAGAA